jgi:hypothetical protein
LLQVVANLICIFLVSCQLVLLSTLAKVFIRFMVKKCVSCCSSEKFHLN